MTNRFKGLDLIDRVPEELRTEVHDIVQRSVIKTIPKIKKCKKAKWLSEEALQIAMKRREMKSKGDKERYKHLNAEFQRIARRVRKSSSAINAKESDQIRSVAQSCPTLCYPRNCSTPGLPVHHQLPEFTQTHVHRVSDAIQPSHPLSSLLLLPPIPPSIRLFLQ